MNKPEKIVLELEETDWGIFYNSIYESYDNIKKQYEELLTLLGPGEETIDAMLHHKLKPTLRILIRILTQAKRNIPTIIQNDIVKYL